MSSNGTATNSPYSKHISDDPDAVAPDGSKVRELVRLPTGSMAQFELDPHAVSIAHRHRTVNEIWFVSEGQGQISLRQGQRARLFVDLVPGVSVAIPAGTVFQFRNNGEVALKIIGVTMPPWPGKSEALPADGPWEPTLRP
jgi:mannose-6-phosphate isomerase-like protein (cupin superfamily)